MKVVFMGTPDFAVETLKAIAGAGHDIAAVVTQPDKPRGRSGALMFSAVKEEAVNLGIECILQPEKARDEAFIQQIRDINPDVIVVVAYGKILPKSLLDIPKYGCINVHASLLPKYRGAAPIQWSVINGDEYSGVTTMFMGEGLDTGDILLQKSIKLDKKETGGSLFDKLSVIGAELLVETLVELKNGTVKRIPQDESQATQVTVFDKSFGKIDFNKSATDIERLIRGLNPWPSAFTSLNGKTLKLWDADVTECNENVPAGSIVSVGKESFVVKCGEDALEVKELQLEGKKRMNCGDFLRGYNLEVGTVLGN